MKLVKLLTGLGMLVLVTILSISGRFDGADLSIVVDAKYANKAHIVENKNIHNYRYTYVPEPNATDFEPHHESYDPQTRIKKVVNRKKVLKKVKKIKPNSNINTKNAKKLNYIPEPTFKRAQQFLQDAANRRNDTLRTKEIMDHIPSKERERNSNESKMLKVMQNNNQPQRQDTCLFACNRTDEFEPIERFTNKTDYLYVLAFIQGLNLVSRMPSASECQYAVIYAGDDYTDTQNNLTLELEYTSLKTFNPMMPTLRILETIGTNFSDMFPYCWKTFDELYDYIRGLLRDVDDNFNRFLVSYLFTQMGYALTYRRIITKIDENNENQAFEANMAQYGQIINQLFLSITTKEVAALDDEVYLHGLNKTTPVYNPLQDVDIYRPDDQQDCADEDADQSVGDDDIYFAGKQSQECNLHHNEYKRTSRTVRQGKKFWKPTLTEYMNFDTAWTALQDQVPEHFFENPLDLPLGDKIAAMIFIGCGLGIAYIMELERQGVQLVSFQEADNLMANVAFDPFKGLKQTSLNIQTLLKDGTEEILYYEHTGEQKKRDEKIASLIMDVVEEFPLGPNEEVMEVFKEIYSEQEVFRSFFDVLSEWALDEVLLPYYKMPKVQASQRLDNWYDFYKYMAGLKDGSVAITGGDSKLSYCNGNLSITLDLFYNNWVTFTVDASTQFDSLNWNATVGTMMEYFALVLAYPFEQTYSCYWAANDMIYRYDNLRVPLLGQEQREDGKYTKVGFWENMLFNFAFNAGYMLRDTQWMVWVSETEGAPLQDTEYWYRYGFVTGDIYMRAFYRSTIDAPEPLISMVE